ncbi:MAG: hypothetical protein AW09_004356 [Candidatus Accumulibacter phosphatis]|uniref:Uncharacterized protein n=1 Tax=Candidatus Accumulibacter phosphatis TaxID=327160 RepID=A0A084Y746_9PROT|nr:MAG: hypothetical protein AW09_004356 [Candidatus Accumulibacter phosphatis]
MADARHQTTFLDRFDEVVERTFLHAAHGGFDILSSGHDDHRHFRVEVDDVRQQLGTTDMRHHQVEQHGACRLLPEHRQQFPAVADHLDVGDAGAVQHGCAGVQNRLLVIDEKNGQTGK